MQSPSTPPGGSGGSAQSVFPCESAAPNVASMSYQYIDTIAKSNDALFTFQYRYFFNITKNYNANLSFSHLLDLNSQLSFFDRLPLQACGGMFASRFAKHTLSKDVATRFAISPHVAQLATKCHADTLTAGMMARPLSGGDWDVTEPDVHKHTAKTCSPRQIHSVHTGARLKGCCHSGVERGSGEGGSESR